MDGENMAFCFKKAFSKAVGGLEDEDQDGIYYE
jgi:hypothetical protein